MAGTADKVVTQISRDIENGTLRPGDPIDEAALSEKFGVSRTPLREAIRSLVNSGVLVTRPRKGASVRELTPKELLDLFEVSAELEGMACRLAATVLTDTNAELVKAALLECFAAAQANDVKRYAAANLAFHRSIHIASGNEALLSHLEKIQIHVNPYRFMPYEVRGRLALSAQEHNDIFDAILAGDGGKAETLMNDHMMLQGKRLPSIVQSLIG